MSQCVGSLAFTFNLNMYLFIYQVTQTKYINVHQTFMKQLHVLLLFQSGKVANPQTQSSNPFVESTNPFETESEEEMSSSEESKV